MQHRAWISGLALGTVALSAALLSEPTAAQARTLAVDSASSVRLNLGPFGGGLSGGPIQKKKCPNAASCPITVRAAYAPLNDDDDDETSCVVRAPEGMVLHKNTTDVVWKLATKAINRGFAFDTAGVVIDNGTNFDPPVVTDTQVTIHVKASVKTDVFSYTVYLKWKKTSGTTGTCAGLDPVIVNTDN